jgi:multiple sugar transport system ATP-binding protein
MGRAIVRDPQVFLFDEPLSNLDAKLRVQMRTEIKELHQRLKTTTVYVTHDQIEAMTMADRIVVMQGGRIEQVGAPLDLYDRPANTFVAAFIGSPSMNLLEGRVTGGRVEVAGASLSLPPGVTATEGQEVVYGIRPEHLSEAAQGLTGTVAVVEPTGSETHVVVRLQGRELTAVFRSRVAFGPGTTITLAPDAAVAHLFDKATGKRL